MTLMPKVYRAFGRTAKGDPRHECKGCGGTFSIGSKTRHHKRTDRTKDILLNLVNKVPLSRICEINGVTFPQVYAKINFIYRHACRRPSCLRHGYPDHSSELACAKPSWQGAAPAHVHGP